MNIFLAGVPGGGSPGFCKREDELNSFWDKRLWTYYWLTVNKSVMKKPEQVQLFMDSGAFSAFTKNEQVELDKYIAFLKDNHHVIDVYANLDVIGDSSERGREEAAKKTLQNQRRMEKAGLDPLPVFHYWEPYKYLEYYIENYDYIALGGLVGGNTDKLIAWLDVCFSKYICGPDGLPKIKVHAFGITSLRIMLRYPWYSVDSTSWVVMGRNGKIMIPVYRDGKYIYDENSWKLSVSARSSDLDKKGDYHFNNLTKAKKEIVLNYIHDKGYEMGESAFKQVDADYKPQDGERWAEKKVKGQKKRLLEIIKHPGLCNQYQLRDELNIIYYTDLEAQWKKWPWAFKNETSKYKLF